MENIKTLKQRFGKLLNSNGKLDNQLMDALFWNERTDTQCLGCYRVQIPLENLRENAGEQFPKLVNFEKQLEILKSISSYG